MLMNVRVRLDAIPIGIVAVLVVGIVAVRMRVRQRGMLVVVSVVFRQMQPDPGGHQARRRPKHRADRLAKQHDGQRSPNEWRGRKVGPGARCAQVTQGHYK